MGQILQRNCIVYLAWEVGDADLLRCRLFGSCLSTSSNLFLSHEGGAQSAVHPGITKNPSEEHPQPMTENVRNILRLSPYSINRVCVDITHCTCPLIGEIGHDAPELTLECNWG